MLYNRGIVSKERKSMSVKIAVIQLGEKQIDALMEFMETRSVILAVDIVDSIIDDLGISDNRKVNNND